NLGTASGSCAGPADVEAAARVADQLGLQHEIINHGAHFEQAVIGPFVDAYAAGLTPNPCVCCNATVKFGLLLDLAAERGCEALATGHYARCEPAADGGWRLRRGTDPRKDQSYVLHALSQDQLARVRWPLGGFDKARTRALAAELGLVAAERPDSQDLCFAANGHAAFVVARRPEAGQPGAIVDGDGRVLGTHRGVAWYTVGQRRGLGLARAEAWIVVELRAASREVVVAPLDEAGWTDFALAPTGEPTPRRLLSPKLAALAQVRYRMMVRPCQASGVGERVVQVRLDQPMTGIAPGQAAVLYDQQGYVLLGGPILVAQDAMTEESAR
ncbi:MAG TPA: tRNA 2-thiouridine(34) synthase MnmA, partial [Armatimonadetes bacterium]|nr:tRNA 2-thiouridine(34) synthase MnmA [Armatimonadota bacterium]